jgi:hypothetical protein
MRASKNESGFALILAILALMLLTFLGLTLVTTTSTELQIATNYRWSQQALYNAEAGVEAAKIMLRTINWAATLPAARPIATVPPWNGSTTPLVMGGGVVAPNARADAWGNPSRNFENWQCDRRSNGVGYGVVLDDGGALGAQQFRTTLLGSNIAGAVTLWIRRPTVQRMDGTLKDLSIDEDPVDGNSLVILTAEGTAPYTGGTTMMASSAANKAVQVVEVVLRAQSTTTTSPCGSRGGQAGSNAENSGFGGCKEITDRDVEDALRAVGPPPPGGGFGTFGGTGVR